MAKTNFELVVEFQEKFGIPMAKKPSVPSSAYSNFRLARLQEEVDEFTEAMYQNNLPEMADALVDLVYIALGTAATMGLPWEILFAEVHRVNMLKKRVDHPNQSRFGNEFDLMKPEGWEGPQIQKILDTADE